MMKREQILFELAALDVAVNERTLAEMPDSALHNILRVTKRLVVMGKHWTNPAEAHEMIKGEGMTVCPFEECRARLVVEA